MDKMIKNFQKCIKLKNIYKCVLNEIEINEKIELYEIIKISFLQLEDKFKNVIYDKYIKLEEIDIIENKNI